MDTTTKIVVNYLALLVFAQTNGVATDDQIEVGKMLWDLLLKSEKQKWSHLSPDKF